MAVLSAVSMRNVKNKCDIKATTGNSLNLRENQIKFKEYQKRESASEHLMRVTK